MKKFFLKDIARIVEGKIKNADGNIEISGVKGIEYAASGDITYAETDKHILLAEQTNCSAVICSEKNQSLKKPCVVVSNPKLAFGIVIGLFCNEPKKEPLISEYAHIDATAKIGKNVYIGANAVIDKNAIIGDNVVIYPGVYIGERVEVGDNTKIFSNVSIYYDCKIGKNVIIHSNTVIGSDGFGYAQMQGRHIKVPQAGNVIIGNNVEIGANTAIDRATTMSTIISDGVKIDNQVHIAHNVFIGENTLIIAQVGIAGSARIGKNCIIAGQTGIRDHITIGDNTIVAPQSGVTKNIKGNDIISGFPAKPHKEERKMKAAYMRLPETVKLVGNLQQAILRLQRRLENIEIKK
ncbi:MAG TPA: UDP-3-O-(3-hydroxymyristoyl)glucosamine N-acyltransferase [bacterium]|nr:UDP-3-O-(3-hydroxymyristoyl)glucosamine N-acyltransferase [bacterium]HPP86266.1 UDP-3-O-(3-hydroxymyristoyl)glucosamine N-acyltransferase [bacterium]